MQRDGARGDQVAEVRGYADQMLRKRDEPLAPSNRRISVIVQNPEPTPQPPEKSTAKPESP
jgi:chemotaxis protein MotB